MKLEQLLNSLIEKGWEPFWLKCCVKVKYYWYNDICFFEIAMNKWWDVNSVSVFNRTLRDIASIDSWLRQFVCKNRFLKWPDSTDERQKNPIWASYDELFYASQYQFYLIESALRDKNKLEDFLLNNIKLNGERTSNENS